MKMKKIVNGGGGVCLLDPPIGSVLKLNLTKPLNATTPSIFSCKNSKFEKKPQKKPTTY